MKKVFPMILCMLLTSFSARNKESTGKNDNTFKGIGGLNDGKNDRDLWAKLH